jgi:hypothetical protein
MPVPGEAELVQALTKSPRNPPRSKNSSNLRLAMANHLLMIRLLNSLLNVSFN